MKCSFTLLASVVGLYQQATAQGDNHLPTTTRALVQSIVQGHHRFLQVTDDDLSESQLGDSARMCYNETETLDAANPNLEAAYDEFFEQDISFSFNRTFCQCSDNGDVACTFDYGSASGALDTACSAANAKFVTMNYGWTCAVTNTGNGEKGSMTSSVTSYSECFHESCGSNELAEILAASADIGVAELDSGSTAFPEVVPCYEGLNVTFDDCVYTVEVFLDGSSVFSSTRSASDSGSFFGSAQEEVGSGSVNIKLTASAFIAIAGFAMAVIV